MISELVRDEVNITTPQFEMGELLEYNRKGPKMIVLVNFDINKDKFKGTVVLNEGEGPSPGNNLDFPKKNFKRLRPTYKIELRNSFI